LPVPGRSHRRAAGVWGRIRCGVQERVGARSGSRTRAPGPVPMERVCRKPVCARGRGAGAAGGASSGRKQNGFGQRPRRVALSTGVVPSATATHEPTLVRHGPRDVRTGRTYTAAQRLAVGLLAVV